MTPQDCTLLDLAKSYGEVIDLTITDTYDPKTSATGCTGLTHDWDVSATLAERLPKPLILAGGLTPDNVQEAICHVRPAGVDVHSKVEGADGMKCLKLVARFVAAAQSAFQERVRCRMNTSQNF